MVKKLAQQFGRFLAIDANMHPVIGVSFTRCAFDWAISFFASWELQVMTTTMNIKGIRLNSTYSWLSTNMPTGTTDTPRRLPICLGWLGSFP